MESRQVIKKIKHWLLFQHSGKTHLGIGTDGNILYWVRW